MTQKNDQDDSPAAVTTQAIYWCLWLESQRRLSFEESLLFVAWLTRSSHHVDEFLCMHRIMGLMKRPSPASRDRSSNVTHVNWWRGSSRQQPEIPQRRPIRGWKVAVTTFVIVSVIFFLARMSEEATDRTVATAVNESKIEQLEDGSTASLAADSALRVEFTELRRNVHLVQGRVKFGVVMDMKRPFIVNTFLVDIAAVDAKFGVAIDTSVEVEVYEGVVAISERGVKKAKPVVMVRKGERYRVPVEGFRAMVARGETAVRSALIDG